MEVIIRRDVKDAAALTARIIANAIIDKPRLALGLATGRTMEKVYAELVRLYEKGLLDFAQVATFNLDEYIGLPPEAPHSYRYYMSQHLFDKVNIDPRNTHLPDGMAEDYDKACKQYEAKIVEYGGIDLQVLGIGRTGHIGFNEPLSAMRSRTREKALSPQTVAQNAPLFDQPGDMPRRALTMGVGTILDARRCILLATGEEKANIIAKAVEGPVTSMISATALQLHPACTIIVDEAAASDLARPEYYRWIFENEPEWESYR